MASPVYTSAGGRCLDSGARATCRPGDGTVQTGEDETSGRTGVPGVNWNAEVFEFETMPVGPCGPAAVVGIATKPLGGFMFTLLTFVVPTTL